ncbi:MAG: CapA family protein [Chloroflexota bacterium]
MNTRILLLTVSALIMVTGAGLVIWAASGMLRTRPQISQTEVGSVQVVEAGDLTFNEPTATNTNFLGATVSTQVAGDVTNAAVTNAVTATHAITPNDTKSVTSTDIVTTPTTTSTDAQPASKPFQPIQIAFESTVPLALQNAIATQSVDEVNEETGEAIYQVSANTSDVALLFTLAADGVANQNQLVYRQIFAAATRFDTIEPNIELQTIKNLWQNITSQETTLAETDQVGAQAFYTSVVVLSDTLPALIQVLGPVSAETPIQRAETTADLINAVWANRATLALLPFEELTPQLTVLTVDGQNPVENNHNFAANDYPLAANVYARFDSQAETAPQITSFLSTLPTINRNPNQLTVIAMTGVTAMVRQTAYQMDRFGAEWPAVEVGPELARADITIVSNEVPFVEGCQTNTDPKNLTFCSKPEYMTALKMIGTDLIGLTGNHQNDFGKEAALGSLAVYAEAGLPIYGGGVNKSAAFAPLYYEHNGNRLAFLGANSYGPTIAWATETSPGSAPFDLNIMSATIRNIRAQDRAKLIFAELQFQEFYEVSPHSDQQQIFRALARAGADVVTGIQSHIPQAVELNDNHVILYGLGNLFFDQMWSQETRDGLIVKHTVYDNRHISTQLLTTILHDYGQPRWADAQNRARILERVFGVSEWNR